MAASVISPTVSQANELEPVVITANRMAQPRSQASVVVDVIDRQQIENSGSANVVELLESLAGVSVNRLYGRMGVDTTVDLGYLGENGSQNVLVLVDGMRINSLDFANVVFAQLPMSAIERIEVRKANGGALYGDRAQGGVIHIITRNDTSRSVSLQTGSFGQQQAQAYVGFGDELWKGSVSAMGAKTDGYRVHSAARQDSAQLRLSRDIVDGRIGLVIRGYEEEGDLPSTLTPQQFAQNPRQIGAYPDHGLRRGNSLVVKLEKAIDAQSSLSVDLNTQQQDNISYRTIRNARTSLTPEWRTHWGRTQWLLGSEIYQASANTLGSVQVEQQSQSFYANLTHPLSTDLVFEGSARIQRVDNAFEATLGSPTTRSDATRKAFAGSLRWQMAAAQVLKLGLLSGYRFANAEELYYFEQSYPFAATGINATVQPMLSNEWFMNWSHDYSDGRTSVHWRHMDTRREIGFAYACDGAPQWSCNQNLFDTRRDVLSLSGEYRPAEGWRLKGALDLVNARVQSGEYAGRRLTLTPEQVVRWSLEKRMNQTTWMLSGHYRGNMVQSADPGQSSALIPSRHVMDFGVRNQWSKDVTVSLWVRNLMNKPYYDFAQFDGLYPADGRSLHVGVRIGF